MTLKTFLKISTSLRLCVLICVLALSALAQTVPAPKDVLGFTPGDDKKLASWAQMLEYFKKLDAASDRVQLQEIGKTTLGRPFVYATISAPENLKNLEKYKQINAKLADPRLIKSNDKIAQDLIKQGKTIVLITCGIHSTEVGGNLASMLIAHRLASGSEPEIQKILENTIVLLVPSLNPDGVDIVKNWYDKTLGTPYEGTAPPELYHKYTGHDNNRDWYAFTQIETQLTVDKIHNVWHPQIVNDIHQQGANGSRLFVPPYMQPVEPNVPKEIVEGYTELGNYILNEMTQKGFAGITNNSIYDAWTPSRAYSHYHGGVRILTETASARLASPIKVEFERLRVDPSDNYDPQKASANHPKPWQGGDWTLRDITNYMTTSTFTLLKHAADNREKWLSRFYAIGKEAVRPRKKDEPFAYVVKNANTEVKQILARADVEYNEVIERKNNDLDWILIIKMQQPYAGFAKAIFERQKYPDLRDEKNNPIPPYDVTAHNISLLYGLNVETVYKMPLLAKDGLSGPNDYGACRETTTYAVSLYRSYIPSMDEGWTRFILTDKNWRDYEHDCRKFEVLELKNEQIRENELTYTLSQKTSGPPLPANMVGKKAPLKTIIFPDQSANQILNGYAKGSMPDEYVGGVGKEGVENLKKFVEAGGTLVFLNRASDFAIEQFNLPVRDVTQGLSRKDFYIPGSILRTELDTAHPIAKGMPAQSIAWFENSPAFEVTDNANAKIIARYPAKKEDILLSGWALGAERIAGKAALVEFTIGKGKIILFGFRPQYRGQSLATFPLLFNAISN